MLRALPALLFTVAAVAAPTVAHNTTAFKVPVVVVHAKDFSFTTPATISAGQTTFRLVNDGKELHHLTVVKLAKGKTLADFQAAFKAMKPGTPPPTWITEVGGPNAAVPGGTIEATLTLEAGNYVLMCFIPSPGETMPHAMKGMMRALTVAPAGGVTQAGAAFAETPKPDVHLVLKDYGFAFSKPLTAGKHVIHVMNEGPQTHEAVFIKLMPGKHVSDFGKWAETGMKGPPPAMPVDGMADLGKGLTAIFPANITPGKYALLCFVPDAKDGKSHLEHGMAMEFDVK
jgi:uncharacterized cupredoxin-like copper-binding protein